MTDELLDLDEITAMYEAATDEPWGMDGKIVYRASLVSGSENVAYTAHENDAQFIAQSRTIIPRLVAELRASRARDTEREAWINRHSDILERVSMALGRHPESIPCAEFSWDDLPDMVAYILGEDIP